MHFLWCSDSVMRLLNKPEWNKVVATIKKLRTNCEVARALINILEGLMTDTVPIPPNIPETSLGLLVKQAWTEQESVGWINVAKGRLCRKWGEAHGRYYNMHPDLRTQKWCTSQIWMRRMIGALLDMSLAMWKNRCDCLHGHSKSEQAAKRKEKIKDKIFWWYNN